MASKWGAVEELTLNLSSWIVRRLQGEFKFKVHQQEQLEYS